MSQVQTCGPLCRGGGWTYILPPSPVCGPHPCPLPKCFPCWHGVGRPPEAAVLGVSTVPPFQLSRPSGPMPWGWDYEAESLPPGTRPKAGFTHPNEGQDCVPGSLLAGCNWDCGFPPSRALRGPQCKWLHSDTWASLHSLSCSSHLGTDSDVNLRNGWEGSFEGLRGARCLWVPSCQGFRGQGWHGVLL